MELHATTQRTFPYLSELANLLKISAGMAKTDRRSGLKTD